MTFVVPDRRSWLIAGMLFAAVLVLAWSGIYLTRHNDRIAAVWLANGVVVAALLRSPRAAWPVLIGAAFGGNLGANLFSGDNWWFAGALAAINQAEALVVAALVRPVMAECDRFDRRDRLGRFLLAGGLAGPLASAAIAAPFIAWAASAPIGPIAINWFVSDSLGMLIVAPLLLTVQKFDDRIAPSELAETAFLTLLAGGATLAAFTQSAQPILFTITPIVLVAAFRLRLFGALLVAGAVAAVAIVMTLAGQGIITRVNPDPTVRMYMVQLFVAAQLAVVLPLRALVKEHDLLGRAYAESERLFHRIAEASPAGIAHFDTGGRPTFANARWAEITGQPFELLSFDRWIDVIEPSHRAAARALWLQARAIDRPVGGEYPYQVSGQDRGWAELSIYPEVENGRLLGHVVRLTDVTPRRRVEEALAEREALYRLVTENAHDVIIRIGSDGRILYASNAARRLFRLDPAHLVGTSFATLAMPDDAGSIAPIYSPHVDTFAEPVVRFRLRRGDGSHAWVEASHRPLLDPRNGELVEVVLAIRDIDRRRQQELLVAETSAKLGERNRLLNMAEDLAQMGHWRYDFASKSIEHSEQFPSIIGIRNGAAIDPRAALALLEPLDRARALRMIAEVCRTGDMRDAPLRILTRDGAVRHVRAALQADMDADGKLIGLFGVVRDKTEYIRAQQELIVARDEAQAAAEAKSHFLATMSHEIRTPMTGVLGMIDLLENQPEGDERIRFFNTLKQSADLLMAVLDDVLDFSKIDSQSLRLDQVDLDLEALLGSTIDLFANAASAKGLLLSLDPRIKGGRHVRGDPVRIQQIVSNLLSNAIKFTDRGRITIALADRAEALHRRRWRIEVTDTGVGIHQEDLSRLFQPFVQADGTSQRRHGGTGLGLAISSRLVEAMGGEMGVDSRPGRGSTFWLDLPFDDGTPDRMPVVVRRSAGDWPPVEGGGMDVLVAEDNPVNQLLIGALLRRLGHRVTAVDNGRLALDQVRSHRFDCVLMDMQMPEMDGLAATRAIRALGGAAATMPIIALTADASPERRRFYEGIGLTDFLTKPIDKALLARRLEELRRPPPPTGKPASRRSDRA